MGQWKVKQGDVGGVTHRVHNHMVAARLGCERLWLGLNGPHLSP